MILPILLILIAMLAAGVVGYGTHPGWADYQHGLQWIMWSRRLEWPLVTLSLLACVALVSLVIAGKRRAWWLIGLGPVLALFLHHFHTERLRGFSVVENPATVDVADARFLNDEDYVVGVILGDTAYAYPFAALFRTPVVLQTEHEQRMILLWSAYANRVLAFHADNDLKGRDLEFVSMPARAPLLFNSRLGEFINGLKGLTPTGAKPSGFGQPMLVMKTTWARWRADHPMGKVMWPGSVDADAPRGPVISVVSIGAATQPMVVTPTRVTLVGTTRPAVVATGTLGSAPYNSRADGIPILLFKPEAGTGTRAFDRRFGDDIRSRFDPRRDTKHPEVVFKDVDTGTLWNARGIAVVGSKPFVGKRLSPVPVDDDVDWSIIQRWYPELAIETPPPAPLVTPSSSTLQPAAPTSRPVRKRSKPAPVSPSKKRQG